MQIFLHTLLKRAGSDSANSNLFSFHCTHTHKPSNPTRIGRKRLPPLHPTQPTYMCDPFIVQQRERAADGHIRIKICFSAPEIDNKMNAILNYFQHFVSFSRGETRKHLIRAQNCANEETSRRNRRFFFFTLWAAVRSGAI